MDIKYNERDFNYTHSLFPNVQNSSFKLHNHDEEMEVLIFLKGDAEFRVEGTVYELEPGDMVIAQCNELHRIIHRTPGDYERIVIAIHTRFFSRNECENLKNIFIQRGLGENNIVKHSARESGALMEIVKRMERYILEEEQNLLVIKNTVIEFLYILNKTGTESSQNAFYNDRVREIMVYINHHLSQHLDLEGIAEHFYLSKYHLCRIFKKHTGFTVNQYITYKRLLLAGELRERGKPLTEAAMEAGFESYSNFYRMYVKENGKAPKER